MTVTAILVQKFNKAILNHIYIHFLSTRESEMSNGAEQVTYSIHVKTSDKLFAGTDNDVYIRIGCLKYKRRLCWKILQIHRFHKYRGFENTKLLQKLSFENTEVLAEVGQIQWNDTWPVFLS